MLSQSQLTEWWLVVVITLSLGACIHTDEEPVTEQGFPPVELIEANVKTTDVTVILEITRIQSLDTVGAYTNWIIDAKVLRSLKGSLTANTFIQYLRTVETNSLSLPLGSHHIVSFVMKQNSLAIPDAGYHFPYSEQLRKQLERVFPE